MAEDHNYLLDVSELLPPEAEDSDGSTNSTVGPLEEEGAAAADAGLEGLIEERCEGGVAGSLVQHRSAASAVEQGAVVAEGTLDDAPQASAAPRARNVEMFAFAPLRAHGLHAAALRPAVQVAHCGAPAPWAPRNAPRPPVVQPSPRQSPPITGWSGPPRSSPLTPSPRPLAGVSARGHAPQPSPKTPPMRSLPAVSKPAPSPRRYEMVNKYSYDFDSRRWVESRIGVLIDAHHFAEGSNRNVHHMVDEAGKRWVAKVHRLRNTKEVIFREVAMQGLCQYYAKQYNARQAPKPVTFLDAFVIRRDQGEYMSCEELLAGPFHKYNNNGGWCERDRNTPHAFSHFTYALSGGKCMVVDIQGVGDIYTDPQLHTEGHKFGDCDLGIDGMRLFFSTHQCSAICAALGLAPHAQKVSGTQPRSRRPLGAA